MITLPRIAVVLVLIFGVLLVLILWALNGYTRVIKSGDYGPVFIGEPKQEALTALITYGIGGIGPVPYQRHYILNPSRKELGKHLSDEAGVLFWIRGLLFPLRIEFENDMVSNIWGKPKIYNPTVSNAMTVRAPELARLVPLIKLEMSREAVFDTLAEFKSRFGVAVGNFVVGYQQFRTTRTSSLSNPDYQELLLANDGWQFWGLKEELWYDPFHSRVTIYFRNDRIERIEHWHAPIELW